MNEMITTLIFSQVRKIIYAACAGWITVLVEKGVLTSGDVDRMIQIGIALALMAAVSLWTFVKNWLATKKTTV